MGVGLPEDKDIHGLEESNYWRFMFGFPTILFVTSIVGMQFLVRYDSPKYLINQGRIKEARKMVMQIYSKDEVVDDVIAYIKGSSQKETSQVSYKDAMFHPWYRKGTWITVILIIFHELAGSNAISLYSNTML